MMNDQLFNAEIMFNNQWRNWKFNIGVYFLILVSAFVIFSALPAQALDDPEQALTEVIEDYVMTKYPEWIGYEIKVSLKYADKIYDSLAEYDEEDVDLSVMEIYRDFKPVGNVIFPILITTKDSSRKIFVRAKVEVFKNVVIANRRIKRGEEIMAEDLSYESRDIAVLPQKYFENIVQVANTEAKTSIPKNSTVFEWMIQEVPLVHRGDNVLVVVTAPNLTVKSEGKVLEDGYLDKKIKVKVKREDESKTLEGILVSSDEVEVKLK